MENKGQKLHNWVMKHTRYEVESCFSWGLLIMRGVKASLTLRLNAGKWSASCPGDNLGAKAPDTLRIGS
jgi:hypothetical protein